MTSFLKILLATSLIAFLASLTEVGSAIAWGFLKPLSAIVFGVFFIGHLFQKEIAKYHEEFRLRMGIIAPQNVLHVVVRVAAHNETSVVEREKGRTAVKRSGEPHWS